MAEDTVLFHDKGKVRVGGVFRYDIYLETPHPDRQLYLRVRNTELAALRAAYLNGPFTLYVDMMPMDYSETVATPKGAEPKYENHLKAGSHFSAELNVRSQKQRWRVTVSSEILFSRSAEVGFEITIGTTKNASKIHGSRAERHLGADPFASVFNVKKYDTAAIWQAPIPRPDEPLHVCILTHGLVSNVTADMLYIKEVLDQIAGVSGENLVCKGYTGNVCRTERGVKYLGRRLANWLMDELIPTYKPARMSFVAHSLGGLIQTYALGFIQATRPEVMDGIELVNFIALASPFLGISHENPGYVQFALSFGVVGKTGRDLGLAWVPGTSKPLLERLPNEHTQEILKRFSNRTVYANAIHDGIVPLRTASLLYLDWRAIGQANDVEDEESRASRNPFHKQRTTSRSREEEEKQPKRSNTVLNFEDNPFASFLFGDNRERRTLTRYQTVGEDGDLDSVGEKLPKKTSLIESGMSLLLPPHPNNEFITDPRSRSDVIFHDRVYYQKDLPKRRFKAKLSLAKGTKEKVDVAKSEERIARNYHNGCSWRKVLVELLPEAHNNVIVRRRFSNAYGWPVVHHLAREHFLFAPMTDPKSEDLAAKITQLGLGSSGSDSNSGTDAESDTDSDSDSGENSKPEHEKDGSPWSESEDERESEPDKDHDPNRVSMFKIIPTS